MTQTRVEKRIQELKDCGQFIADNAEKIISTYDRATDIQLLIRVQPSSSTKITISTECLPYSPQQ